MYNINWIEKQPLLANYIVFHSASFQLFRSSVVFLLLSNSWQSETTHRTHCRGLPLNTVVIWSVITALSVVVSTTLPSSKIKKKVCQPLLWPLEDPEINSVVPHGYWGFSSNVVGGRWMNQSGCLNDRTEWIAMIKGPTYFIIFWLLN